MESKVRVLPIVREAFGLGACQVDENAVTLNFLLA